MSKLERGEERGAWDLGREGFKRLVPASPKEGLPSWTIAPNFIKSTLGILTNEEGQSVKSHSIARVLGIVLILSALVFLASWRGDDTTPKGLDSPFQIHQVLDAGAPHHPQKAIALPIQQYVAHAPVSIKNNADFAALGFPGEGSPSNPYVIEGLNITANKTLIHIQNTTAHFSIRNNLLNSLTSKKFGIHLVHMTHGTIDSNIITNCGTGVILSDSGHCTVAHNSISQCGPDRGWGIILFSSRNSTVVHNTVTQCEWLGISLSDSEQNTVAHNTVAQCEWAGITLEAISVRDPLDAGQNTVAHNAVSECEAGIRLAYSAQNIISNNTVSNCRKGIYLYDSRQNTLVGNQLVNNGLVIELYLPDRWNYYITPSFWPVEHYVQATVAENVINGRPLVLWQNVQGGTVPAGAGQVILLNSTGVEVTGQDLAQVPTGVFAVYCSHLAIHHNTVSECGTEGVALYITGNSTVAHNSISQCGGAGIKLDAADQNTLLNNTVSECGEAGIVLTATSGQNTLVGNQLVDNGLVIINLHWWTRFGHHIQPIEGYLQATVAENLVNGRPLIFWQNVHGGSVPPGAGQVILLTCSGIEVTGGDLSRVSTGVFAAGCSHLTIHHNTFSNNSQYGIHFHVSGNSIIANNTISECGVGIHLFNAEYITLTYNTVTQNTDSGIYLYLGASPSKPSSLWGYNTLAYNSITQNRGSGIYHCGGNTNVFNNTVTQNRGSGIYLSGGNTNVSYNTITQNTGIGINLPWGKNTVSYNTVTQNTDTGISIDGEINNVSHNSITQNRGYGIALSRFSKDNTVKWNDFLSNHPGGRSQASDEGKNNVFARNYWDDHDTTDRNEDGIADTPYPIDGDAWNQDLSPLTVLVDLSHRLSTPIIAYPNGGEILQGTVTLHWTAAIDTWEHSVTYTVSYSADDGSTWIPLVSGLLTSEYEWDTTTVADGSVYRVQVVATCSEGLTVADVSDAPFTIQNPAATTTVGTFPLPGMPVVTLLVTLLLLLAMHAARRGKHKVREGSSLLF